MFHVKRNVPEKFLLCQLDFTHILYSRNNLFLECYVIVIKKEASISSLSNSYARRNESIICSKSTLHWLTLVREFCKEVMTSRNICGSGFSRIVLEKVKPSRNARFITFTLRRGDFISFLFYVFKIIDRINFEYFLTQNDIVVIILTQNDITP